MKWFSRALLILSLLTATRSLAQSSKLRAEKEPAWVVLNNSDYKDTKLDPEAEGGYVHLLFDKQVSIGQQATYLKQALRIISESGVQNASEINVDFDPSYSQLVFHSIYIIRGTEKINKLQLTKFKTIQQESELNRHLYNGALSAVLFLEDVRKGDIVEYSYTIKGFNPVFKGKYASLLSTSFSVPMYHLHYRILLPRGRQLTIKNSLTDIAYKTTNTPGETIYDWTLEKLPAVHLQDRVPAWYDPYAMVLVSEYKDWKEVSDWALPLFPFNNKLSPSLKKKIEEIKRADSTTEKRVQAALRFVQDDVRYLGIEMGDRSHKPHHPDKVFAQRFGDCKDKSYLLCTILRAMDIDARPVLINATYGKNLKDWLPAPNAFDHVTVRVRLDGQTYWFDPTIAYQRGKLRDIAYPDYQHGLVIDDSTTALTAIAPQNNKGLVDIKEEFTIPSMEGPARLVVRTTYSGSFADDVRDDFNSSSLFEMRKTFQTFYAGYFENATIDSLNYTDDEQSGKFTTWEYYTIPEFWEKDGTVRRCSFAPFVINGVLKKPKDANRTMPFYITHPAKYLEEVIVNLPEEWNYSGMLKELSCAAFTMRAQAAHNGKKLKLKYEYESLKDHVLPSEAKAFFKEYKSFEDETGYSLSKGDEEDTVENTPEKKNTGSNAGIIIIAVLLISGAILWWTQRR